MNLFNNLQTEWKLFGLVALVASIVLVGAVLAFVAFTNTTEPGLVGTVPTSAQKAGTDLAPLDTSSWQTYRNDEYGFEVRYPKTYDFGSFFPRPGLSEVHGLPLADWVIVLFSLESSHTENQIEVSVYASLEAREEFQAYIESEVNNRKDNSDNNRRYVSSLGSGISPIHHISSNDETYYIAYLSGHDMDIVFTSTGMDKLDQILSTFRFIDVVDTDRIKTYALLYIGNTGGFGAAPEWWDEEVKQIEDVNGDGRGEFFFSADGAGGTCVGGTDYKVLYSPKDKEYFVAGKSFLPAPRSAVQEEKIFCPIVNENQVWAGCGDSYVDYVCFSNNLKEEKNAAFKKYLEESLRE